MARQAHVIGNGASPPNDYLVAMEQGVRELDAFAAVVYSSNFDNELLLSSTGGGGGGTLPAIGESYYSSYEMVDRDAEADAEADADADAGSIVGPDMVQSLTSTEMLSSWISPSAAVAAEKEQEQEQRKDDTFEQAWGRAVDEKEK